MWACGEAITERPVTQPNRNFETEWKCGPWTGTEWHFAFQNGCKNFEKDVDERVRECWDSHASSSHELFLEPRREGGSGKCSIKSRYPKDWNCEICQRTKIFTAPCRRRVGEIVFFCCKWFWWYDNSWSQSLQRGGWISEQSFFAELSFLLLKIVRIHTTYFFCHHGKLTINSSLRVESRRSWWQCVWLNPTVCSVICFCELVMSTHRHRKRMRSAMVDICKASVASTSFGDDEGGCGPVGTTKPDDHVGESLVFMVGTHTIEFFVCEVCYHQSRLDGGDENGCGTFFCEHMHMVEWQNVDVGMLSNLVSFAFHHGTFCEVDFSRSKSHVRRQFSSPQSFGYQRGRNNVKRFGLWVSTARRSFHDHVGFEDGSIRPCEAWCQCEKECTRSHKVIGSRGMGRQYVAWGRSRHGWQKTRYRDPGIRRTQLQYQAKMQSSDVCSHLAPFERFQSWVGCAFGGGTRSPTVHVSRTRSSVKRLFGQFQTWMTWRVFFTEAVHKNKWCKKVTLTRWWSLNFSVVCQIWAVSLTIWKGMFLELFKLFLFERRILFACCRSLFCLLHLCQPWSFMPRKRWSSMPVPDNWYEVIRVFDLLPSSDHSVPTRSTA